MRLAWIPLLVLAVAPAAAAQAPNHAEGWDIGLMLGSPTGISVKRFTGGSGAFQLGAGAGPGFRLHGDYQLTLARPASGRDAALDLYLGGGLLLGVGRGYCGYYRRRDWCGGGGEFFVGGRVPLGLDVRLQKAPVSLGLELAPGVVFGPDLFSGLFDAFVFVRFMLGR